MLLNINKSNYCLLQLKAITIFAFHCKNIIFKNFFFFYIITKITIIFMAQFLHFQMLNHQTFILTENRREPLKILFYL